MKRKPSFLILVILFCLSGTLRAEATTYTVKAGGGGNYTTVQACAMVVKAGDTCQIYSGTYNEVVNVPASGSSGNQITFINSGTALVTGFKITGQNHITITGLSLGNHSAAGVAGVYLSSASYIIIANCYISYVGGKGVQFDRLNPSNYIIITNNTITWVGYNQLGDGQAGDYGIDVYGDYNLIESNDISHASDYTHIHGSFDIVRRNIFHDSYPTDVRTTCLVDHLDGMQTWGSAVAPVHHMLIENNQMFATPQCNTHFALLQDFPPLTPPDNAADAIVRYNVYYGSGGYFTMADGIPNVRVYNNTVANITLPSGYVSSWTRGASGGVWLNNIVYNSVHNGTSDIATDSGSGKTRNGYSLVYNSGYSGSWHSSLTTGPGVIVNRDPLFVASKSNFALRSGSRAIGAGGPLTKVAPTDTGSGTSLIVNDAGMFQDGYKDIVNADWIRVGATKTAQISSIDYSTNTITLTTAISRSPGDPVYLYKDSNGRIVLFGKVPDIGAFPYGAPAPPSKLTTVPH